MKKNYFYILSFSATFLYWCLDAYANTLLYGSSFLSEFLLAGPHNAPFIKIGIALIIFVAIFLPFFRMQHIHGDTTYKPCIEELDSLKQLTETLYSPLSPKVNITKALEKLATLLGLEASILFTYTKDTLLIYNETTFVKSHFHAKELFPFRPSTSLNPLEKIANTCFIEKRLFSQDTIVLEDQKLTLTCFIIKEAKNNQVMGNLMLVSENEKSVEKAIELIQKFIEQLSFTLYIALKKDTFMINNEQVMEEKGIDKDLNILNYLKIMEKIEHEFKRNRRYHTELTLMLIDIPMLKNLINIFPDTVIATLKKDVANLIKKNIREVDILGKWSHDQLALLLPDVDFRAAQGVAKKIQMLLENQKFTHIGRISCSFGITSLSKKDALSSFRLRAENALSLASNQEGNQIEVKLLV
ncbi:MAG: GGDEF domain-containing protein [Sulfurospirillaceae bacterium]|nr:GGDEF domain-containing protein [Sulfurospirillaceae bacterium]MDD2827520.1 GGDEF domain-containing protein [Sulfurospirillaceae bacterium]